MLMRTKSGHLTLFPFAICVIILLCLIPLSYAVTLETPYLMNQTISNKTNSLQVLGYKGTTLYIQRGKQTLITKYYKDDEVKFISLTPQKAGQTLKLYLQDSNGNTSPILKCRVEAVTSETLNKRIKQPKVLTHSITSKTKKMKVKGTKGTKLIIKNDRLKTIKTVKFWKTGSKTVRIPAQKDGTALYFYLKVGKKRGPVVRKAVRDLTAPAAPEVSKQAKGNVLVKGELGAAVYLKNARGKFVRAGFITSKSGITLKDAVLKNGTCSVALEDAAGNRSKTTKVKPLKFSLTIAEERDEQDPYRTCRVCTFNEATGKLKTIATLKHNAQYTLTYYDGKSDYIYYVTNADENRGGGDQLFSYNIKTKKSKQLTKNLYAINHIVPTKGNKLFLAGVSAGTHTVSPMCYDISTGKLEKLEALDPDLFVNNVTRDPKTGVVYMGVYSSSEDDKMTDLLNGEKISEYGIDNTIYSITSDGKCETFYTFKKLFLDSFAVSGNKVVCNNTIYTNQLEDKESARMLNVKSGKVTILQKHAPLGHIDYLDDSGRYVYADNGDEFFKINLKTKKKTVLFTIDAGEDYLNNVQPLS